MEEALDLLIVPLISSMEKGDSLKLTGEKILGESCIQI